MKVEANGNSIMREHKTSGLGYTDTASSGVSSNDTHRSSVRYEPVVTDHSCTPPSPGRHGSRHRLLGANKHRSPRMTDDDVTDEDRRDDEDVGEEDDIASMDDVVRTEELRPLNPRRRMSSPVIIGHPSRDQYMRRDAASVLARANSGTVYAPNEGPTTLPIDPRHAVLPRMGTGLHPPGATVSSQATAPITANSLFKPQVNSIVTSRMPTSQTTQFDPVVMTTMKQSREANQSEWSYVGGSEVRNQYPFSGGVTSSMSPPRHPAATASGEDTTARFMNRRPSAAIPFNASRHIGNPSYEKSGFKTFQSKFPSRCSWKCATLLLGIFTFLLLALLAYLLVQSFTATPAFEKTASCRVTNGPLDGAGTVVVIDKNEIVDKYEMQPGRKSTLSVPPNSFWRSSIYIPNDGNMKFNFTVNRRASFGVYGRKGIQPSHTKFDFFEKIDGSSVPISAASSSRKRRDIQDSVTVSFIQFLESGKWYIGVFNDGENDEEAIVGTNLATGLSVCPNNCNEHGDCVDGVCKCFPRYQGKDCAETSCPVVCSGRGLYAHGGCVCFSGWKGKDCSTPTDECEVPDCSGHGTCQDGECECEAGRTGTGCETVTCLSPTCSDHGVCVQGVCHCDRGWKGRDCNEEDSGCFEKCSGHGTYSDGTCICEAGWAGRDCSEERTISPAPCLPACDSQHGTCIAGKCECDEGWTGETCRERKCHDRCEEHGICSNGECVCEIGWNGDLCSFEGCPDNCGSHGHCRKGRDNAWACSCDNGWKGENCNTQVELTCDDGRDNDRDTLTDCHDPDCCESVACRKSPHCRSSADPSQLIRTKKQIPATFYDRVKFLVERSSQNIDQFDAKTTSVLRGKVVTLDGSPLVGVKVKVKGKPTFGYVRSRTDGWFDIIVNGGGSETLQFERALLLTIETTIFVPLNDFVIVPTVSMRTASQPDQLISEVTMKGTPGNCDVSLFPRPQAIILPTDVDAFTEDNCDDRGSIIPETQAVRETINLPFSGVDLIYLSSRTSGYKSKIEIQLTGVEIASNLRRIHVRISIQGSLHEKMFEPLPETKYSFIWDQLDAYKQPVYGDVTAKVEVGYEYELCPSIVWDFHLTKVKGRDPIIQQAIGGWSVNIHHNYHSGAVHLGNGGMMKLNRQPPMMSTVMGTGAQRHTNCEQCAGPASSAKLMAPVSLACDSAGNIFIGDYNYIRKIDTNGMVSSLLFLRNPPHKYHVAVSPTPDGTLYYSDPNAKRVYKIRNMNPHPRSGRRTLSGTDVASNMEVVAGTGEACLPLAQGNCGDGGPALSAKLSRPSGLTVDKRGRVFFVDGTAIRVIDVDGTIKTFAGSHNLASSRPLPCDGTISLDQLQFDYPTDITINMFDESLYVLDSNFVIRIDTRNMQASLVAGVPIHCARKAEKNFDERDSRRASLVKPGSIVSSPLDGSLYIAEADNQFVNRVRRVDPYRLRISTVAGAETACDCQMSDCDCFEGDGDFARSARLNTPAALAASPNGSIYIADQLNMRIRKISSSVPEPGTSRQYRIANPDSNQVYVFSSNGLHRTTQNVITGATVYNFSYTPDGALSSIVDVHGNRLSIVMDKDDVPTRLVLPNRKVLTLEFDSDNGLHKIREGYSSDYATISYQGGGSRLLRSITQGRAQSSFYVYDVNGRLVSAVSPTGGVTTLHATANATTHTLTMTQVATSVGDATVNQKGVGSRSVVITTQPGYICDIVTTQEGEMRAVYKRWTDNSISVHFLDGSELVLETKPHPILGLTAPFLAKRTIHLPQDPLENNIEWRRRKRMESGGSQSFILGRRMRVNGRNILSLDYSQNHKMEKIYDDHTKFVLRIKYDNHGMPTLWMPPKGITPVNVTYDRYGHPVTWARGGSHETLTYDDEGHVTSVKTADNAVWSYLNQGNVVQLTVPSSNSHYTYTYDNYQNVRRVTVPSGGVFEVTRLIATGFIRTVVETPHGEKMSVDHDDKNNILMKQHLGENRKVVYRYNAHGHLTEVLHDKQRTRMLRDPHSGELTSMETDDATTRFQRNGPLVQTMIVTSQAPERSEVVAKFDFSYDMNLRLKTFQAMINDTNLPADNIQYDDVSGKVTSFGGYSVLYYRMNMYVISSRDVMYTKEHDYSGRLVKAKLEIYRNPVFVRTVQYDIAGRISSQDIRIGAQGNITRLSYQYLPSGLINKVIQGSGSSQFNWKYYYNKDGKLLTKQRGSTVTKISYKDERVTACGPTAYLFDRDGFLRTRGEEVFEYDSLGQLVFAFSKDGTYRIKYGYDGFGRLSSRLDEQTNQILKFYYADILNPTRLTHYFNSTSGLVATIRYDMEGVPMAMDLSNDQTWLIMCDHNKSPVAVVNGARRIAKEIRYSPFGETVYDSNEHLQIVLGYRGGIYDPDTRLVHFADRSMVQQSTKFKQQNLAGTQYFSGVDYDPAIGQMATPDYSVLLGKRERIPKPLKDYQIWDPVNPVPPYDQMTRVNSWLDALGFKLQNVAPDPKIDDRQKDKSSVECQLSHHLQTYINLQTVAASSLVPQARTKSKIVANGAMFAQGLTLSVDRGVITTSIAGTATNDVKRLGNILNGGQILIGRDADTPSAPMSFTSDHKPIIYITKPFDSLRTDEVTLTMAGSQRNLDGGYSDAQTTSLQTSINVVVNNDVMTITSSFCIVKISYVTNDNRNGKTESSEEERITENARVDAEAEGWVIQKDAADLGYTGQRWNHRQLQQLKQNGKVAGYKAVFFWNVKKYPEFSDSGRNIEFKRT